MSRRLTVLFLCALVAPLVFDRSALAHAILVEAMPAPNATVEGPELRVELKFNSRIDAKRSQVTILTPDNVSKVLANDATSPPDVLRARGDGFAPGAYRLKWQVLSSDGHITRGEHPFSIK